MQNKKSLLVIGLVIILGLVVYRFRTEDMADNGKVYSNKMTLCQHFAQSYLRTIQKTDNIIDFDSEKWKMAVDIETDFYNICLLDLSKEALKNYKLSAIEKYQK